MKKEILELKSMEIVGLQTRTNNLNETNPLTAKISDLVLNKYFGGGSYNLIQERSEPGVTYCVYSNYENGIWGDYDYLVGEQVNSLSLPQGFKAITIEPGKYVKLTTEPGMMPQVLISAWQKIWQMTPEDFSGVRNFRTDFEKYSQPGPDFDPTQVVVEIYLGID